MVFCVNYILNHIYLRALKRFDMVHTIVPPFDILGLQIDIFEATKKSFLLKSYQQQATNDCTNKLAAIAPQYRLRLHPATTGSNPKHTIYAFFDSYY